MRRSLCDFIQQIGSVCTQEMSTWLSLVLHQTLTHCQAQYKTPIKLAEMSPVQISLNLSLRF